jgi:hypothetical protein
MFVAALTSPNYTGFVYPKFVNSTTLFARASEVIR